MTPEQLKASILQYTICWTAYRKKVENMNYSHAIFKIIQR